MQPTLTAELAERFGSPCPSRALEHAEYRAARPTRLPDPGCGPGRGEVRPAGRRYRPL